MAVFTAAATAIVGFITGAGFAATAAAVAAGSVLTSLAVGVVAAGLAAGTAKLLGIFDPPQMGKDPGVKIQLPPATDNKVPRMYGRNYTSGIVIDAEIKNKNETMAYCLVISEYNDSDTWTVADVYRGDAKLVFSGATVTSQIDPNATSNTEVNGKMRCRVYAGGSTAAHQIFPTTGAVNAYGGTTSSKSGQFLNWSASNTMEDLVFAVFEIDYDPENNLAGLGAITFDINNSLNNPANVLLDYLQNDRYGAGLSSTILDTASFDDWRTYSSELVDYIDGANVTQQHSRYQIDGALSTFDTNKQNIGKICQSGGAFFTYDGKVGKFGVVVNRAATTAEQANAFVFNPDNILSDIKVTSTDLFNLYNAVEAEYPSVIQRDQTDIYFAEANASLLNPNEPVNILQFRLDMCNDRSRVAQLANVDLNQSRLSMVVELTADFSALQVEVGDVVKLTDDFYGFSDKLFRCMRIVETEDGEGVLSAQVLLLEYDDDVYGDLLTQEDLPPPVNGIDDYYGQYSQSVIDVDPPVYVVDEPGSGNAFTFSTTGTYISTVSTGAITDRVYATGAGMNYPFIAVKMAPDDANIRYNEYRVIAQPYDANNTELPGNNTYLIEPTGNANFFAGQVYNHVCIPTNGFGASFNDSNSANKVGLTIRGYDTVNDTRSKIVELGPFVINPSNFIDGNGFVDFAPGEDVKNGGLSNSSFDANVVFKDIAPPIEYDLTGAQRGDYDFDIMTEVVGSLPPNSGSGGYYELAIRGKANVTYANATATYTEDFTTDQSYQRLQDPTPPSLFMPCNRIITVDPGALHPDKEPVSANIWVQGYNTMGSAVTGRGFEGVKYNLRRINKGVKD